MSTAKLSDQDVREAVQERYADSARSALSGTACGCGTACCGGSSGGEGGAVDTEHAPGCGDAAPAARASDPITSDLYNRDETPFDTALAASLGCGNPTALADLRPGDDVLDLGSGGGLDVLLSARRIGPGGTAYGLDMTPEMLELAERNRAAAGVVNARFLRGTIEQVPLPDASVDVVISNCVINLSPDKDAVLREAFRVLRPAGRFAVSDIVLLREIPDDLRGVLALWTGCVSGALRDEDYLAKLAAAGFREASIEITRGYTRDDLETMAEQLARAELPGDLSVPRTIDVLDGAFASAFVRAVKP